MFANQPARCSISGPSMRFGIPRLMSEFGSLAGRLRVNRTRRSRTTVERESMGIPRAFGQRVIGDCSRRELCRTCKRAAGADKIRRFLPVEFPQSPLQVKEIGESGKSQGYIDVRNRSVRTG